MNGLVPLILMFAASYGGLSCLCMAMDRHYADLHGRGQEPAPALRRWLRMGGCVGLALALSAAIRAEGATHGLLMWCGSLTGSALLLVLLLPYGPRRAVTLAFGAGGLALLSGGAMLLA